MVISEICCNSKVSIYIELQTKNRYDHRRQNYKNLLYGRRLLQVFDAMIAKYTLKPIGKRKYYRNSTMSKAEVMLIMILFHDSGYRCFKHFYLEKVCKQLRHLFPKVVSYNRIVELEREVAVPLTLFIKKVLLGKCTGISFVDSTPLRVCKNIFQRLFVDGIQFITKLKSNMKGALMSVSDRLLLRKRAIVETVKYELKNIVQVELSRHRCFDNFIVNLLGAIAAYCLFPKKPCINVQRTIDTQLALF